MTTGRGTHAMTECKSTFRLMAGGGLLVALALSAGCAPTPVTRTVTTQTTTTAAPPPPVVTTTVEEVKTPDRPYVRQRVAHSRRVPVRTDEVVEETTETQTVPVVASPVVNTTTRSTTLTTNPR